MEFRWSWALEEGFFGHDDGPVEVVLHDVDLLLVRFWTIKLIAEILGTHFDFIDGLAQKGQVPFFDGLLQVVDSAVVEVLEALFNDNWLWILLLCDSLVVDEAIDGGWLWHFWWLLLGLWLRFLLVDLSFLAFAILSMVLGFLFFQGNWSLLEIFDEDSWSQVPVSSLSIEVLKVCRLLLFDRQNCWLLRWLHLGLASWLIDLTLNSSLKIEVSILIVIIIVPKVATFTEILFLVSCPPFFFLIDIFLAISSHDRTSSPAATFSFSLIVRTSIGDLVVLVELELTGVSFFARASRFSWSPIFSLSIGVWRFIVIAFMILALTCLILRRRMIPTLVALALVLALAHQLILLEVVVRILHLVVVGTVFLKSLVPVEVCIMVSVILWWATCLTISSSLRLVVLAVLSLVLLARPSSLVVGIALVASTFVAWVFAVMALVLVLLVVVGLVMAALAISSHFIFAPTVISLVILLPKAWATIWSLILQRWRSFRLIIFMSCLIVILRVPPFSLANGIAIIKLSFSHRKISGLSSLLPLLHGFLIEIFDGPNFLQLKLIFRKELLKHIFLNSSTCSLLTFRVELLLSCFICTLFISRFALAFHKTGIFLLFEIFKILLGLQLRNFFDFAFQRHVGLLQILNVLMLHLVHIDRFQNLQIFS